MRWWAWMGVVLAQTIGWALMLTATIPYQQAASNVSTYLEAFGFNTLAEAVAESALDQYATWIGVILVVGSGLAFWWFRRRKRSRNQRELQPNASESNQSRRIKLLDFAREAERQGWRTRDPDCLESLDFLDGIRQAGVDGAVCLYGKKVHRFAEVTSTEPLLPIPKEHWETHQIDLFGFLNWENGQAYYAGDNFKTTTRDLAHRPTGDFADIHLDRAAALHWLETEGPTFRGRRDERERQKEAVERLRKESRERISLREATVRAYEQTHGTLPAAAAEELSNGDIEGWYAAAITKDRDVAIYGRKPPSRVHVEVPQVDLQSFMFKKRANELVNQFDEKRRYVDLEISEEDAERKIREIKQWQ